MKTTSLALRLAACALGALLLGRAAGAQQAGGAPPPEAAAHDVEPVDHSCLGKARVRGAFAFKADEIEPGATVVLDLLAEKYLRDCVGKTVLIEGHTDLAGSPEVNQQLSERRAETVKRYMVGRGVPAEKLRTIGYGETRPLSTDPSPEAQAVNRRVTFVVLEP